MYFKHGQLILLLEEKLMLAIMSKNILKLNQVGNTRPRNSVSKFMCGLVGKRLATLLSAFAASKMFSYNIEELLKSVDTE